MRKLIAISVFFLSACVSRVNHSNTGDVYDTMAPAVKPATEEDSTPDTSAVTEVPDTPSMPDKTYFNARFKGVTVTKLGEGRYQVSGKAQIFEAAFSWVVEDGHNELAQGHEMTDAGAPEWGNFKFTIDVKKQRPNSVLTLILFEISAKDGSRVHELPIALK